MSDDELMSRLGESPWERLRLAADVGEVANTLSKASLVLVASEVTCAPREIAQEVSDALDAIVEPRTVRVSTDLTWSLE